MIFAIVITYKNPERLKTCLRSLEGQADILYVRDNSEENLLYTAGINVGIRKALKADADYILICCDDVLIRPGAVTEMARFLDEQAECGIAMPVQVSGDEVTCGGCTAAFPYGRHVNEPLGHQLYSKPYESYWANGACFLLRAEAVRECGLLDEGMRFICSDSDYSFTLRARGWKIFVVPSAIVEHEPNGALKTMSPELELTKDKDSLYFAKKWLFGGLFGELSAEAGALTPELINNQINLLRWRIQQAEEALSEQIQE